MYEDDLDDLTVPCPVCQQPVFEDAPQCPQCGHYLDAADFNKGPSIGWVLVVGLLIATWLLTYVL